MKDSERKVIIYGQVFRWEEKAPFVPSGKSVQGAMEYDATRDEVRCHECGGWFRSVATHLRLHKIPAREYKFKHGLRISTPLDSPTVTKTRKARNFKRPANLPRTWAHVKKRATQSPRTELANLRGECRAQLGRKIAKIAEDLQRQPSRKELSDEGLHVTGRTLDIMREVLGPVIKKHTGGFRWAKPILLELLRDFYALNGRVPSERDWNSRSLPDQKTYRRHFGSLPNAYLAAGLLNPGIRGQVA